MPYQHVVVPQKIRLTQEVDFVPQVGHDSPIIGMSFDAVSGSLAALDASPAVLVWSADPAELLLVAPLPSGEYDRVIWLEDQTLAVRQLSPEGEEPLWLQRPASGGHRWRPVNFSDLSPQPHQALSLEKVDEGWSLQVEGAPPRSFKLKGSTFACIDPLKRYLLATLGQEVHVFDYDTAALLHSLTIEGDEVVGLETFGRGAWVVVATRSGQIQAFDPLRPERRKSYPTPKRDTRSMAVEPAGRFVALGDAQSQLTLFDVETRRRLLRTRRNLPGFMDELVLTEDVGYFGFREESFGAYLYSQSHILPLHPLPARATACTPGPDYPLVYVSHEDGRNSLLDLREETIEPAPQAPWPLTILAAGEVNLAGAGEGGLWWHDGAEEKVLALGEPVRALASSRDGDWIAAGLAEGLLLWNPLSGESLRPNIGVTMDAAAFGKWRGKEALFFIEQGSVLWRFDMTRKKARRVGVVLIAGRRTPSARIKTLTVDADGTLRALAMGDNAHRLLLMLSSTTAEANLVAGLVVVGHQIVAVYDNESTRLRQELEHTVRFVQSLRSYETRDWLRNPEKGL